MDEVSPEACGDVKHHLDDLGVALPRSRAPSTLRCDHQTPLPDRPTAQVSVRELWKLWD